MASRIVSLVRIFNRSGQVSIACLVLGEGGIDFIY